VFCAMCGVTLNARMSAMKSAVSKALWQSHGIGSALLERSLLAARNRGIQVLHVCCLFENQRMQQLARKFEGRLSFDLGTVMGWVENPYPTPLSVLRELVLDGQSFGAAYVDFHSRLLLPQ
jgi:GNAT superfamily N-acetyltransferase